MMGDSGLLHLAAGAWELEVQPARGGAVTALRHRGRPVLVSTDPATVDAMGAANFVLVPYANRIARGHVSLQGRQWTLPLNFGDHAHPLHGTGWKRPWTADGLDLRLPHTPDAHWPWAFSAQQRIRLQGNAIRFELHVINDDKLAAPMGVGFHPAFAACATTRLRTQVESVWLTEADLPQALAPARAVLPELPGEVAALRSTLVDHCFTRWSRELQIENAGADGDLTLQLSASTEMDFLQLYMPPGKRWFCAEPMTQMPDAIHRHSGGLPSGLRLLAPGESLQVWMQIAVR